MLDFVFTVTIFLEIILTCIIVIKIQQLETKIKKLNEELTLIGKLILEINSKIKDIISKINKVVAIFKNKKLIQISKIIKISIDIIQIIILIRSFNLTKGIKSINIKTIKKLFLAQITKSLVKKIAGYAV